MIYLDNAATSYEKPKGFYGAMNYFTKKYSVNSGRGGHRFSLEGMSGIIETSENLCEMFSIESPDCIAYSLNATMSLNQAIGGILSGGGHAVVTQMEHNSVLRPVHAFGNYTIVNADSLGRISAEDVRAAIREDTRLVVSTHASNVCGTVMPIEEIGKIAHENGAYFLVDAAQTAGCKPIDVDKMNIDMMAFSAHKGLLGPLGVGGLYVKSGIKLMPVISGGTGSQSQSLTQPETMPDMLQAGTMNTPAIMALGESILYINKIGVQNISDHQRALAFMLIDNLKNMSGVTVYGITSPGEGERNGTVLFNIDGIESGELCEILDRRFGIAARGGWHCAYPAHCALGSEKSGALRASFGVFSNKKSVRVLTDAVHRICRETAFQ